MHFWLITENARLFVLGEIYVSTVAILGQNISLNILVLALDADVRLKEGCHNRGDIERQRL